MAFADHYLIKFNALAGLIKGDPAKDLGMIITIPSFNEPNIIRALEALSSCLPTKQSVEVIVCFNYPEDKELQYADTHKQQYLEVLRWSVYNNTDKIKYFPILQALPPKHAGVGLARKIAMDQAIQRFNKLDNPKGIITGYDADCTCALNYLESIENLFISEPGADGCSVCFEHPVSGIEFDSSVYNAIIDYELYLRYYIEAQRNASFPLAFHTLGSSFAVTANAYIKQGGMNRRKAGEDFYFLHKIIPLGNYHELNSTAVYPSPRTSDRVPFGTGAAVQKILDSDNPSYLTFNNRAFDVLKKFWGEIPSAWSNKELLSDFFFSQFHPSMQRFLIKNNYKNAVSVIIENTTNLNSFMNRFFSWFNGLMVLQYLNEAHEFDFQKIPIEVAVNTELAKVGMEQKEFNKLNLLNVIREYQKKSTFKYLKSNSQQL